MLPGRRLAPLRQHGGQRRVGVRAAGVDVGNDGLRGNDPGRLARLAALLGREFRQAGRPKALDRRPLNARHGLRFHRAVGQPPERVQIEPNHRGVALVQAPEQERERHRLQPVEPRAERQGTEGTKGTQGTVVVTQNPSVLVNPGVLAGGVSPRTVRRGCRRLRSGHWQLATDHWQLPFSRPAPSLKHGPPRARVRQLRLALPGRQRLRVGDGLWVDTFPSPLRVKRGRTELGNVLPDRHCLLLCLHN